MLRSEFFQCSIYQLHTFLLGIVLTVAKEKEKKVGIYIYIYNFSHPYSLFSSVEYDLPFATTPS